LAWRWLSLREVTGAAQGYRQRTPPRTVRHHLKRFITQGLVERVDDLEPYHEPFWRWSPLAPTELVEWLETAAAAAGLLLEPLGTPPSHCEYGHELARYGRIYPEGSRLCLRCLGEVETALES
jgi:hypothetical protein